MKAENVEDAIEQTVFVNLCSYLIERKTLKRVNDFRRVHLLTI
jgi:hypothetical protein